MARIGWYLVTALIAALLGATADPCSAFTQPDSGQTKCYQAASPHGEIPCAETGQDGAYTINAPSYTDNGDGTVSDSNTGLLWQKGENGKPYNWYQASGTYDATYNPSPVKDVCGALVLGGFSDWRLPTKKELTSIVDYAVPYPGPTVNAAYFPGATTSSYWSSTMNGHYPNLAWSVSFSTGYVQNFKQKYYSFSVRCVRGGQSGGSGGDVAAAPADADAPLRDNGNGTVTDLWTGLVWQKGENATVLGEPKAVAVRWSAALSYCENLELAGSSGWRLPNVKELESLSDDSGNGPAIDPTKFPKARAANYWASTTDSSSPASAWYVNFAYGFVGSYAKYDTSAYYVRCVRGGQYGGTSGDLAVVPTDFDFGTVVVPFESAPKVFTVTNEGTVSRTITAIGKTGPNPSAYRLQNNFCSGTTLAPEATCKFEIVFAPLPPGYGTREATLIIRAGTEATAIATLAGTGGTDAIAPTGSLLINNGDDVTATTAVTLVLAAADTGGSGLESMRFSRNGVTAWSGWEPYQPERPWSLTIGAGTKSVYVQYRDRAGNVSDSDPVAPGAQPYGDTIIFAPAPPTATSRVSVSSAGAQGSDGSRGSSISADGRYVAFESHAPNLVPGDANASWDVFVHDRVAVATTRISIASGGAEANDVSHYPAISADGRHVAFYSDATNMVPDDTNGVADVFVHDRKTGATTRASVNAAGIEGDSGSYNPSISPDGRYVVFESMASNLALRDFNGLWDVFVRDRVTGQTSLVSLDSAEGQGNHNSIGGAISADGRYVAFGSTADNLVPGDTNFADDVFVRDRLAGTTSRVSVSTAGGQGSSSSFRPSISADGRYVVFESYANTLVPGDTNGSADVFLRDLLTGATSRVSVDSAGAQGNGHSYYGTISADGLFVSFESMASNLVPGDTNGTADTFVRELPTGTTTRVSVDSAGMQAEGGMESNNRPQISADGRFVAFESAATNLVPLDTNGTWDVILRDRLLSSDTQADMRLVVTSKPASVRRGANASYVFTVSNNGPESAENVTLIDVISKGTPISLNPSQGTCSASAVTVCRLGTLAAGASATVAVTLRATANPLTQQLSVSAAPLDGASANDGASVSTRVTQ